MVESNRQTGELLAEISNMVVGVYADCLGRGPTRARSYIDNDVVLCLLENTLTKPERQLQMAGSKARLLELRVMLQQSMEDALATGMERVMGRKVTAVVSGRQLDPDIASEVFLLGAPLSADEPGEAHDEGLLPDNPEGRLEAG